MIKRILYISLFATILIFGYLLFTRANFDQNNSIKSSKSFQETQTLRVAYGEWPPDLIVYLAKNKGFFEKNNLNVELVKISGFDELFELIDKNEIDIWPVTLLDSVIALNENKDWSIFLLEDFSAGADALITYPDSGIKEISDLKGRTVGVETETVGEFFLAILLERENLTLNDINIINLSFDAIPQALKDGIIDAGMTYEPSITESLEDGAVVVVDSQKESGVIVDVFASYKQNLEENRIAYIKFSNAILEASDFFANNPEESIEIMKIPFNNSNEELANAFEKLVIPDYKDNVLAFNRASGYKSLYILGKQAEQYLEEQGIITPTGHLESLFSSVIEYVDNTQ